MSRILCRILCQCDGFQNQPVSFEIIMISAEEMPGKSEGRRLPSLQKMVNRLLDQQVQMKLLCSPCTALGEVTKYERPKPLLIWEPSIVTGNYENIRRLIVVLWSQTINTTFKQEFTLSYLVQPLESLKYFKDLVQIHLTFEEIGPKM